jgi:hypothetical protein
MADPEAAKMSRKALQINEHSRDPESINRPRTRRC